MNGTFSFGSYYPGDGVLHRLDPRTKLLLGFAFLIVALTVRSFAPLGVVAAFIAVLYVLSGVPVGKAVRSLAPLLAIVVIVALLNLFTGTGGRTLFQLGFVRVTEGGVSSCVFTALRLTLMMAGMSLITMTTMTLDLTAAFERLLAPFARFGLPAHELGMILGIALRFIPQFATELADTYRAQVSRGANLSRGPLGGIRMLSSVTVPLFASVFRHAETLSEAMDARCYHGEQGRNRLHPLRFQRRDAVAAGVFAAFAVLTLGVVFVTG